MTPTPAARTEMLENFIVKLKTKVIFQKNLAWKSSVASGMSMPGCLILKKYLPSLAQHRENLYLKELPRTVILQLEEVKVRCIQTPNVMRHITKLHVLTMLSAGSVLANLRAGAVDDEAMLMTSNRSHTQKERYF